MYKIKPNGFFFIGGAKYNFTHDLTKGVFLRFVKLRLFFGGNLKLVEKLHKADSVNTN